MTPSNQHWLGQPNVTWSWALAVALIWGAAVLALAHSPWGVYLESRIAAPIDFRLRELLGRSPIPTEKLKIYIVDDGTAERLGSWVLTIEDWRDLLTAIAAKKPRGIFIDAIFGSVPSHSEASLKDAVDSLATLSVPIYSGAFLSEAEISGRPQLNVNRPEFSLESRLAFATHPDASLAQRTSEHAPSLVKAAGRFAYGPSPLVTPAFRRIGHLNYDNSNRVAPFLQIDEATVIPHLTLYLAGAVKFEAGRLLTESSRIPLDRNGYMLPNFISEKAWFQVARSVSPVLQKFRAGKPIESVTEGDVVLILPAMFTGHTDWKSTPLGYMGGGWIYADILNSIMTGAYLTPLSQSWVLLCVACALAMVLALQFGTLAFFTVAILVSGAALGLVTLLFSYASVSVNWLFPLGAFWAVGISVFAQKTRIGERKATALRLALEGAIAPSALNSLIRHPEKVRLEARERVITLMFIDVVGFSLVAENMLPRIAFENLKRILNTLTDKVHHYGGIVDKTLGDGLLCYFGYSFDSDITSPDHAEQALRCAIKIQEENLRRNIEAASAREPVYPLRIGINTASCYLGDLGTNERIDFTVVGNGVNFAKRLEGACEVHSVLFGATTRDLVMGIGLAPEAIAKRLIRIKHHSELVEAFEYDPFFQTPELRGAANEGFRASASVDRLDQRWPVNDPTRIAILCDQGPAEIVNFSHYGISLKLNKILPRGAHVRFKLDANSGKLQAKLAEQKMADLEGEVRWGYATNGGFIHGIFLKQLDREQSEFLVQCLVEFAFAMTAREASESKSAG